MSRIILVRRVAVAAAYASAYLAPGTTIAATAALTIKTINCIMVGHYALFAVRLSSRVLKAARPFRRTPAHTSHLIDTGAEREPSFSLHP